MDRMIGMLSNAAVKRPSIAAGVFFFPIFAAATRLPASLTAGSSMRWAFILVLIFAQQAWSQQRQTPANPDSDRPAENPGVPVREPQSERSESPQRQTETRRRTDPSRPQIPSTPPTASKVDETPIVTHHEM